MKKVKIMWMGILAVFLIVGSAWANTYNFSDNTINWPGWTPQYTADVIGIPSVYGLSVVTDANNNLQSILINMANRNDLVDEWINGSNGAVSFDALFINTGGVYQDWDYYVEDTTGDNATGATLYSIGNAYTYKLATQPYPGLNGRWGHPAGIADGTPDTSGLLGSVIWDGTANTLTYSFNPGIVLGQGFQIGYSQWCANDVVLTPEPMSLLLLGLGLIGVAGIRRKF